MVKRFDVKTCVMQEKEGSFVRYTAYSALEKELAQLSSNSASTKFPTWQEVNSNMLNYLTSKAAIVTDDIANAVHQSYEFIGRKLRA